jgi:hypothetical protein
VQNIPENTMAEETDGRQDVHNSGVDTQIAAAHLCGQTDLRTGRTCTKPGRHQGTCEFVPKDAAREVADDPDGPARRGS